MKSFDLKTNEVTIRNKTGFTLFISRMESMW
jgi:hypothetical protein